MIDKPRKRYGRKMPERNNMPNTEAEDYHFPKNEHPCKMKAEFWLQMMEEKGFKVR